MHVLPNQMIPKNFTAESGPEWSIGLPSVLSLTLIHSETGQWLFSKACMPLWCWGFGGVLILAYRATGSIG